MPEVKLSLGEHYFLTDFLHETMKQLDKHTDPFVYSMVKKVYKKMKREYDHAKKY